jgi:hypothetical protein
VKETKKMNAELEKSKKKMKQKKSEINDIIIELCSSHSGSMKNLAGSLLLSPNDSNNSSQSNRSSDANSSNLSNTKIKRKYRTSLSTNGSYIIDQIHHPSSQANKVCCSLKCIKAIHKEFKQFLKSVYLIRLRLFVAVLNGISFGMQYHGQVPLLLYTFLFISKN